MSALPSIGQPEALDPRFRDQLGPENVGPPQVRRDKGFWDTGHDEFAGPSARPEPLDDPASAITAPPATSFEPQTSAFPETAISPSPPVVRFTPPVVRFTKPPLHDGGVQYGGEESTLPPLGPKDFIRQAAVKDPHRPKLVDLDVVDLPKQVEQRRGPELARALNDMPIQEFTNEFPDTALDIVKTMAGMGLSVLGASLQGLDVGMERLEGLIVGEMFKDERLAQERFQQLRDAMKKGGMPGALRPTDVLAQMTTELGQKLADNSLSGTILGTGTGLAGSVGAFAVAGLINPFFAFAFALTQGVGFSDQSIAKKEAQLAEQGKEPLSQKDKSLRLTLGALGGAGEAIPGMAIAGKLSRIFPKFGKAYMTWLASKMGAGSRTNALRLFNSMAKSPRSVRALFDGSVEALQESIQETFDSWADKISINLDTDVDLRTAFFGGLAAGGTMSFIMQTLLRRVTRNARLGKDVGNKIDTLNAMRKMRDEAAEANAPLTMLRILDHDIMQLRENLQQIVASSEATRDPTIVEAINKSGRSGPSDFRKFVESEKERQKPVTPAVEKPVETAGAPVHVPVAVGKPKRTLGDVANDALQRIKDRQLPGKGRQKGGTTLGGDMFDISIVAAARAARGGVTGAKALQQLVRQVAKEHGRQFTTAEINQIARTSGRIVDAGGGDPAKIDAAQVKAAEDLLKTVTQPGEAAKVQPPPAEKPAPAKPAAQPANTNDFRVNKGEVTPEPGFTVVRDRKKGFNDAILSLPNKVKNDIENAINKAQRAGVIIPGTKMDVGDYEVIVGMDEGGRPSAFQIRKKTVGEQVAPPGQKEPVQPPTAKPQGEPAAKPAPEGKSSIPDVLFHGTNVPGVTAQNLKPGPNEIGVHVGSEGQAAKLAGHPSKGHVVEVPTNQVNNPLRLNDEGAQFTPAKVAKQLVDKGLAPKGWADPKVRSNLTRDQVNDVIRGHGFDSIVYKNTVEGVPQGELLASLGPGGVEPKSGQDSFIILPAAKPAAQQQPVKGPEAPSLPAQQPVKGTEHKQPHELTKDEAKADRRFKIVPDMGEGIARVNPDGTISLSDAYFDHTPAQRESIMGHEFAHFAIDPAEPRFWRLVDSGAIGVFNEQTQKWEGSPRIGRNPEETLTELFNQVQNEGRTAPAEVLKEYPEIAKAAVEPGTKPVRGPEAPSLPAQQPIAQARAPKTKPVKTSKRPATKGSVEPAPTKFKNSVSKTIKTGEGLDWEFGNAAWADDDGSLRVVHVTDDPDGLVKFLDSGKPLTKRSVGLNDLGLGLYGSAVPQVWQGRFTGKWSFLERLSDNERRSYTDAMLNHPNLERQGYLTKSEQENARRLVGEFRDNPDMWRNMLELAGQPYNMTSWKAEFLEPLGITPAQQPQAVTLALRGKFAEIKGRLDKKTYDALRKAGYDGAYVKAGMASIPQLVVWNRSAVTGVSAPASTTEVFGQEVKTVDDPGTRAIPGPEAPSLPAQAPVKGPEAPLGPPQPPVKGPPPEAQPDQPSVPDERRVALNKAAIAEIRKEVDLTQLDPPHRKSFEQSAQEAIDTGTDKTALDTALEVNANPRGISDAEHIGMVMRAQQLLKELDEVRNIQVKATQAGHPETAAAEGYREAAILLELNKLTEASDLAGTEVARALNARKIMLKGTEFTTTGIMRNMQKAKGASLTQAERKQAADLAAELKAVDDAYKRGLEDGRKKADEQAKIDAAKMVAVERHKAAKRAVTTKARAKSTKTQQSIKAKLKAMGNRVNEIVGASAEASYLIGRLAIEHIKMGALTLDQTIANVKEDLPNVNSMEVIAGLNARNPETIARVETEVQEQIRQQKQEAGLIEKIGPLMESILPESQESNKRPTTEEIKDLQHAREQLLITLAALERRERSRRGELPEPRAKGLPESKELRDIRAEIAENEQRTRLGQKIQGFKEGKPEEKRTPKMVSAEIQKLKSQIKKLRNLARDPEVAEAQKRLRLLEHLERSRRGELPFGRPLPAEPQEIQDIRKKIADNEQRTRLVQKVIDAEQGKFDPIKERAAVAKDVAELQKKLRQLRAVFYKSHHDSQRLSRLLNTVNQLEDQITRGFRVMKGQRAVDTPEIQQAKKSANLLLAERTAMDNLADLRHQLKTGNFKIRPTPKVTAASDATVRNRMEAQRIRRRIQDAITAKAPIGGIGGITKLVGSEAIHSLRSLKATADISFILRQNAILTIAHPILAKRAFGPAFKAVFSQTKSEMIDQALLNSPNGIYYTLSDLKILDSTSHSSTLGQEMFQSRWIEKVWGLGHVIRGSNRHATAYSNLMRASAFDLFLAANPNATKTEMKAIADFYNVASGIGNLGGLERSATLMSAFIFAPKLTASRFQTPLMVYKYWNEPRVRKQIATDMVRFVAFGNAALVMAHMAGAQVNWDDPDSSDWGKIRIGDTRIDLWGGFQQGARMIARILKGTATRAAANAPDFANDFPGIEWLASMEKGRFDPLAILGRFSSYKAAPGFALALELIRRKTIIGQPTTPTESMANAVVPLMLDDIWEAAAAQTTVPGAIGAGALAGFMSGVGLGTDTFSDRKPGRKPSAKVPKDSLDPGLLKRP